MATSSPMREKFKSRRPYTINENVCFENTWIFVHKSQKKNKNKSRRNKQMNYDGKRKVNKNKTWPESEEPWKITKRMTHIANIIRWYGEKSCWFAHILFLLPLLFAYTERNNIPATFVSHTQFWEIRLILCNYDDLMAVRQIIEGGTEQQQQQQ